MNDATLPEIQQTELTALRSENTELKKKISVLEAELGSEKARHLNLVRDAGQARQQLLNVERERDSLRARLLSISATSKYPKDRKPEELPVHVANIVQKAAQSDGLLNIMKVAHAALVKHNLPGPADDIVRLALGIGIHIIEATRR